jgi:hypothetical protein
MNPHVFLVAGEESGDRLGAALISAIKDRTQGKAHFSGVGGAQMAAEGVPSLFPLGDLAIVGFSSIPAMLSKSCGEYKRPPMPSSRQNRMFWSSSTVRNSPIAWRAAYASAPQAFLSSIMFVPRSGRGVREGRARCGPMSITCWLSFRLSPKQ